MLALKLEAIGDNIRFDYEMSRRRGVPFIQHRKIDVPRKPWVARLVGKCSKYGWKREFIRPQRDYTHANGPGSRGVYLWYWLTDGVYQVHELTNWKKSRTYFIRVRDSQMMEVVPKCQN